MNISLGSWAFSFGPYSDHPVPFEDIATRLCTAGYDGIEICGFPPHVTLSKYPSSQTRKDLVHFLADRHLGVSGYDADFSSVNPVISENRTRYLDLFARNAELCAEIGSPSIRVDTVAAPGSLDDHDYKLSFDRLADVWHAAAGIALKAGVRMVWEFEPGFAFNKPSEVLAMHQAVAHPNFAVLFDTCHAYTCGVMGARQHGPKETLPGGVEEFLRKLEGRIGAIHLIDSTGALHADETSTHAPFGLGRIDFKHLAPKILEVPGIDWWCIDMCFWAGAWELIDSSLAFVRALPGTNRVHLA
jgi:sugar phosphate isomerase/epimerase